MTADGRSCLLITIPISHYCEKARWALERAQIPYRERQHMQGLHRIAVRRAGGGETAPVLVTPDGVLPESADILHYADERAPADRRIYPDDPDLRAEVHALEDDFDGRLGPEGRRWMYHQMRGQTGLVVKYTPKTVPAWQRYPLPVALPLMSRFIDRVLDITPETAAASERRVRETFDEVGERLGDGRPYLTGDTFTAADLTFAALAAAVVTPPEYGVPLPQPDELPEPMAKNVRELREHPAGRHALKMFREHRR
jgi:glutathione S-transferase